MSEDGLTDTVGVVLGTVIVTVFVPVALKKIAELAESGVLAGSSPADPQRRAQRRDDDGCAVVAERGGGRGVAASAEGDRARGGGVTVGSADRNGHRELLRGGDARCGRIDPHGWKSDFTGLRTETEADPEVLLYVGEGPNRVLDGRQGV